MLRYLFGVSFKYEGVVNILLKGKFGMGYGEVDQIEKGYDLFRSQMSAVVGVKIFFKGYGKYRCMKLKKWQVVYTDLNVQKSNLKVLATVSH